MDHRTPSKHLAALHIEELYQQTKSNNQQWLLTYLDVFVLIIMLVISLIALSDFKSEEILEEAQSQQNQLEKPPPQATTISKEIREEDPSDIKPEIDIQKNIATEERYIQQAENLPISKAEQQTPNIQEKTTVLEYHNNNEYKEDKPKLENQLSDEMLQEQLKKTVDQLGLTDSVDMKVTQGYAQLEIQDKILFTSSDAKMVIEGENLLKKLTPLLAQSSGLIYIEGHTDDRPIKTSQFPSNWELGAARATSVLHYLTSQKLEPSRLRAITYGDTMPIADNATKEGREKNRRVSLVIKISDKVD